MPPRPLEHVTISLHSLCKRLPSARAHAVAQDLTVTTADDIDVWLQASYEQGLAPSSINSTLSALRQFFSFLLDEGHLVRHPIRRHRHHVILPQSLPRPMAEADIVAFFRVIDTLRDRLIFLLMLRCGLRVAEVTHLPWSAVNLETGSVRIDNGKDHVDRVVYFSSDVEQALRQWQGLQGAVAKCTSFPAASSANRGNRLANVLFSC